MSEIEELRATVEALARRVKELEDHRDVTQLVLQYGPSVDSGSAEATAALWTDDGTFDAVGAITMQGHDEIAAMRAMASERSAAKAARDAVLAKRISVSRVSVARRRFSEAARALRAAMSRSVRAAALAR